MAHGKKSAREINRASVVLLAEDGKSDSEIAQRLGLSRGTGYNVGKKYRTKVRHPLGELLQDAPRRGRPLKIASRVEVQGTMLAGSDPPAGAACWPLPLIADKVVKLGVIDSLSQESVRQLLKKTNLNRGSRSSGA